MPKTDGKVIRFGLLLREYFSTALAQELFFSVILCHIQIIPNLQDTEYKVRCKIYAAEHSFLLPHLQDMGIQHEPLVSTTPQARSCEMVFVIWLKV